MDNSMNCQEKTKAMWSYFSREAKLRLMDAKDAKERAEWRRTIREIGVLSRRAMEFPLYKYVQLDRQEIRQQHSV